MIKILKVLLWFAIAISNPSSRVLQNSWPLDRVRFSNCESNQAKTLAFNSYELKEALLATRINSLTELNAILEIEYFEEKCFWLFGHNEPKVHISHCSNGKRVSSILESGVSEGDFRNSRDGDFWDRLSLGFKEPFVVIHRNEMVKVFNLARRRPLIFGQGDVAFYDLAEAMVCNITDEDMAMINPKDTSEKGYINSFNHINAQALVTSMFSESLADFIADAHERFYMPELLTGKFTAAQIQDPINNPIDNYVDLVNNEWGQELGILLRKKYRIDRNTIWTPELLANYLNEMQRHYSWSFNIDLIPFRPTDELMIRFSNKMNQINKGASL